MRVSSVHLPKQTASMGLSSTRIHNKKRGWPTLPVIEAAELTIDDLSSPFLGTRAYDDSQAAEIFWSMP